VADTAPADDEGRGGNKCPGEPSRDALDKETRRVDVRRLVRRHDLERDEDEERGEEAGERRDRRQRQEQGDRPDVQ